MSKYEPGDVVRLKSGGPLMTVTGDKVVNLVVSEGTVKCVWFGPDGVRRKGVFEEAWLVAAPAPPAS